MSHTKIPPLLVPVQKFQDIKNQQSTAAVNPRSAYGEGSLRFAEKLQKVRRPIENMDTENYYERERPFLTMKRQCKRTWQNMHQLVTDAKVFETLESISRYLMSNPILLVSCLAAVSAVAIPLLVFILFAVINVAFAFTGFIIIEVAVLGIGAAVLSSVLFCVISTITVMGLCLVLMYYIAYYILSVLRSIRSEQL